MVVWIKMPLGTGVGLGPGDIAFDGELPRQKGTEPPTFRPSIVAKRLDGLGCHLVWR